MELFSKIGSKNQRQKLITAMVVVLGLTSTMAIKAQEIPAPEELNPNLEESTAPL